MTGNAPRILLLGAGASFGARNENPPPLGNHLAQYLLCWLSKNDPKDLSQEERLEGEDPYSIHMPHSDLWQDYDGTRRLYDELRGVLDCATHSERGFESEMDKLLDQNRSDLLSLLHRTLTWSMLTGRGCRFLEQEDLFDELLSSRHVPAVIITLNYDTLLEAALERLVIPYWYPGLEEAKPGVYVYKLHGSINFRQVKGGGGSHDLETARSQGQDNPTILAVSDRRSTLWTTDTTHSYAVRGHDNLILELKQANNTREPIIAAYAPNKPTATNPGCLASHRQSCLDRVAQLNGSEVTAIGIRFPSTSDDPDLSRLLEALGGGPKLYVSPDDNDCREAENRGFKARRQTFEEFLGQV